MLFNWPRKPICIYVFVGLCETRRVVFIILPVAPNLSNIILCLKRAGHLPLDKTLDLIGYLRLETHTVPLLQGLGYLENIYQIIEKRNEFNLTKNFGVRRQKTRETALI